MNTPKQPVRTLVSETEWEARVNLAAAYRLIAHFGMSDLVYNHVTCHVPGHKEEILINPYGLMYEEITASSLIKINLAGDVLFKPHSTYGINPAGYVIHSAIHGARTDVDCMIQPIPAPEWQFLPLNAACFR